MSQQKYVRAEKEEGKPVAVVYGGGVVGGQLAELLRKEGLRVMVVDGLDKMFPLLEKPKYVFFFATEDLPRESWREAVVTTKRNGAKLILGLTNVSSETEDWLLSECREIDGMAKLVEIRGSFETGEKELFEAAKKIMKLAFSSDKAITRLMLVGKTDKGLEAKKKYTSGVSSFWQMKEVRKVPKFLTVAALAVLLLFVPLLIATGLAGFGGWQLKRAEKLLIKGDFGRAKEESLSSGVKFDWAAKTISSWSPVWNMVGLRQIIGKYYSLLLLGTRAADGLSAGITVAEKASNLARGILYGELSSGGMNGDISEMKAELSAIDFDLGLIEAQWPEASGLVMRLGIPDLSKQLPEIRSVISKANIFLGFLPNIVGRSGEGKKTYLVVFQNSSELRPTGGFIGSYGIVTFDQGKVLDFKVNDIYSADGQLRGRIQPPDEILHFMGQTSWYMRDANWAADWELSAQRLEWFLEKETGEKVDGVWGMSLPAVQKLLLATGELTLAGMNETVSATNFYQKAEYASEINFFPGSTQKRDFIGATSQALLEKITSSGDKDWIALGQAVGRALTEKDVMMYFNDGNVQSAVELAGWGGSIVVDHCGNAGTNCLMVVDANLGANKANYFLKRAITLNVLIGKGGDMENRVAVSYQNNSPSASWPGGVYKNYVRFLVPVDSELTKFDLGDKRRARVSEVLTAEALNSTPIDQFLVFKNLELSAKSVNATGSALLSFGAYFEVPVGETKTIVFSYHPGKRLDFNLRVVDLGVTVLKQPGTGEDPLGLVVDYPSFLEPSGKSFLVFPQKLTYNTDLSVDRKIDIRFKKVD